VSILLSSGKHLQICFIMTDCVCMRRCVCVTYGCQGNKLHDCTQRDVYVVIALEEWSSSGELSGVCVTSLHCYVELW